MNDIMSYRKFAINQAIEQLKKKLSRLKKDTEEWIEVHFRIESLKKDLDE